MNSLPRSQGIHSGPCRRHCSASRTARCVGAAGGKQSKEPIVVLSAHALILPVSGNVYWSRAGVRSTICGTSASSTATYRNRRLLQDPSHKSYLFGRTVSRKNRRKAWAMEPLGAGHRQPWPQARQARHAPDLSVIRHGAAIFGSFNPGSGSSQPPVAPRQAVPTAA